MPRIPDLILDCVVYLYPSEQAALENSNLGGSGFLVLVKSATHPNASHIHAVTNAHVIEGGCSVLRVNTRDGSHRAIYLKSSHWYCHPDGEDVAVSTALAGLHVENNIRAIREDLFASADEIVQLNIGIGDDVFMAGRFAVVAGKVRNSPSLRFGNISMMPGEKIPTRRRFNGEFFQQEGFLVEMRSVEGSSGSPVFVYSSGTKPNFFSGQLTIDSPYVRLLGINFGHLPDHLDRPSNMAGVVPAWLLHDLLYREDAVKSRNAVDALVTSLGSQNEEKKP